MAFESMGVGSILGGVFGYLGAREQASTAKEIASQQLAAIQKMRETLYRELEPGAVNQQARAADVQRAASSLALQGQIDPALLQSRYAAQQNLLKSLTTPEGQAEAVASQLVGEIAPDSAAQLLKTRLIDAALDELDAGATLPPEVQSELIQAGLEKASQAGMGTQRKGGAGDLARRLIGSKTLELQRARQDQAMKLNESAQSLANQRAALLAQIFPNLKNLQTVTQGQQAGAIELSSKLQPDVGLSGTNVADLLLARVGANQQLTGQQSQALSGLSSALGQSTAAAYGSLAKGASGAAELLWNNVFKK